MSPRNFDRSGSILRGALECFADIGVEATTIGDICNRSGASVGSIYHHFGSKQGVVSALIASGMRDSLDHLRPRLQEASTAQAGISALITSLLTWVQDNETWARFTYLRTAVPDPEIAPVIAEVSGQWTALVGDLWEQWVATRQVRAVDAQHVAPLLLGPSHDLARRWLAGQVDGKLPAHAQALVAAAWRSVSHA